MLDGGAHFYDTYECADGKFISIGSIEPQFYMLLREAAGVADDRAFDAQHDRIAWPELKAKLAAIFVRRTRDDWDAIMAATDICYAPVLAMGEAPSHSHNAARGTFAQIGGAVQPMPAPRYSVTESDTPKPAPTVGADTVAILEELGLPADLLGT